MNDAELVQHVSNGNESAFRFLIAKHQRLVLHVVGRVVQQQADAEDVCQEVFMKVFRKIDRFRGDSKLSTWIATIAYNTSISYVRKQGRHRELSYDEEPLLVNLEKEQVFSHKTVEKEEAKKYLLQLIEKLPVNYRTVLTLYHLEEFSYKEIEEITGMPEGTVKSYLSRARKILKEKLEEMNESEKTNIFVDYA
ncbi:MAG TPA: RNA polymerase sigma factor [Tangfeifania sp.]|nr:RNA polymerase sigma factor [Tangfeifania sp.]